MEAAHGPSISEPGGEGASVQRPVLRRLLPEDRIHEAFGMARWLWRGWIYTPAVTIWTFLSQCLSADHSCRDRVAGLIAWRLGCGLDPCSADTGAYCTARDALPEEAC